RGRRGGRGGRGGRALMNATPRTVSALENRTARGRRFLALFISTNASNTLIPDSFCDLHHLFDRNAPTPSRAAPVQGEAGEAGRSRERASERPLTGASTEVPSLTQAKSAFAGAGSWHRAPGTGRQRGCDRNL